jgi:hypothetical protein
VVSESQKTQRALQGQIFSAVYRNNCCILWES